MAKYSINKIKKLIEEHLESDGNICVHSISPIRNGLFFAVVCYYKSTCLGIVKYDEMPTIEIEFYNVRGFCIDLYEAMSFYGDAFLKLMKESPIPPFLNANEMEEQLELTYSRRIDGMESEDDNDFHFTKLTKIDDEDKNRIRKIYEKRKDIYTEQIKIINDEIKRKVRNYIDEQQDYASRCYDEYDEQTLQNNNYHYL